jgi:hypothetical protein
MYERTSLKSGIGPADTRGTGHLMDEGSRDAIREVPLKARLFRTTVTAAMLAAVIQSFGAVIKW